MIESANLKMLRNLEAFQVFSDILAFLQEEESVEEPLKGLCDTFAARLSDYGLTLVPMNAIAIYAAELARLDSSAIMYIPWFYYSVETLSDFFRRCSVKLPGVAGFDRQVWP